MVSNGALKSSIELSKVLGSQQQECKEDSSSINSVQTNS